MILFRSKIRTLFACRRTLCAAVLGIALCCSALTPAIKLALPEQVSCGMECCLEDGFCCCLLGFDGQHPDDTPMLAQAKLSRACSPHCATAPSASPTLTPKAERQSQLDFLTPVLLNRPHEQQRQAIVNLAFSNSGPRAPPISPLCLSV